MEAGSLKSGDPHINARSFEGAGFTSFILNFHLETPIIDPITEMGVPHTYIWSKSGDGRVPRAPPVPRPLKFICNNGIFILPADSDFTAL